MTGPFHGLQAEKARIPFANVGMVKLPDSVNDDQAILISDIFPTGYFGADMAEIDDGDTVAVFGCGPVGQFAILSAHLYGAGRVLAVDHHADRLEMARNLGAEVIDFNAEDPVQTILELTGGIGVDRAIDAVGVDAQRARSGPAAPDEEKSREMDSQARQAAPETHAHGETWKPGDAPVQVLEWVVSSLAKAGTLSIIGIYPPNFMYFPIGMAMNKNLTVNMGNCNHRRYIPDLVEMVASGSVDPTQVLTRDEPFEAVMNAYEAFDNRRSGWIKVKIEPHR